MSRSEGTDPAKAPSESSAPGNNLPATRASAAIDRFLDRVGEWLSWIWLVLLVVIVVNVLLRYALGSGRIEFEEAQWHLYAVGFLGAIALCVRSDSHIRVDVLHERFSPRMQAWIDFYGILLLGLPFCALVLFFGIPFVAESFAAREVSPSPGGLPGRFIIKSALPLGFAAVALAFISRLLRLSRRLFGPGEEELRG